MQEEELEIEELRAMDDLNMEELKNIVEDCGIVEDEENIVVNKIKPFPLPDGFYEDIITLDAKVSFRIKDGRIIDRVTIKKKGKIIKVSYNDSGSIENMYTIKGGNITLSHCILSGDIVKFK